MMTFIDTKETYLIVRYPLCLVYALYVRGTLACVGSYETIRSLWSDLERDQDDTL